MFCFFFFFFQAEDGIRDLTVTGVQTCALPIFGRSDGIDPTDAKALATAPLPLARRAIRSWLRCATDAERHPPDAATVERVLDVARGESKGTDVGGGRHVVRSSGRLTIRQ